MISNSGKDERGSYRGGVAGDQGGEWVIIPWYDRKPWDCVLRHPNPAVRETIATLAEKAANNNNIGYDQNERNSYWNQLSSPAVGFDPSKITVPVEADCSAGVIANVRAAGYLHGIDALKNIKATYTGNMKTAFANAGFQVLTDPKYLTSDLYLLRGDILLNEAHHTATNLTDGLLAKGTPATQIQHLNMIDIASWQQGMIIPEMIRLNSSLNGFIIKATGGSHYKNPYFDTWARQCISSNIPFGLYHFLNDSNKPNSTPEKEAEFFVNAVSPYVGKAVLALDWEGYGINMGADGALSFLNYVKSATGVTPLFYTYSSALSSNNCSKIAQSGYKLWVANYGQNNGCVGFDYIPSIGNQTYFGMPVMFQYTSRGHLNGWNGDLDFNAFYGSIGDWTDLAKVRTSTSDKDITAIAKEVLDRKWGNGEERRTRLIAAGYDYNAVQAEVNRLLRATKTPTELAIEVLNGLWGNGEDRKARLTAAGYDYDAVQNQVNFLVRDWARRFVIGEAGNGTAARTNWLMAQGISPVQAPAIYSIVQNYLNKNINNLR